jgi:hypothetical protein
MYELLSLILPALCEGFSYEIHLFDGVSYSLNRGLLGVDNTFICQCVIHVCLDNVPFKKYNSEYCFLL